MTEIRNLGLNPSREVNRVMEPETIGKNGASLKSQISKKNKCCLIFFVCLFFFGAFSTYAQDSKLRIAVIDIHPIGNDMVQPAQVLTSLVTTELVNTNKFRVAERSRIEQIINELGLQSTQDASVRAAEIGKLLGVHKIITGECSYYYISFRFIDVESGDIEVAVTINRYEKRPWYKDKKQRKIGGYTEYRLTNPEVAKKFLSELLKKID